MKSYEQLELCWSETTIIAENRNEMKEAKKLICIT